MCDVSGCKNTSFTDTRVDYIGDDSARLTVSYNATLVTGSDGEVVSWDVHVENSNRIRVFNFSTYFSNGVFSEYMSLSDTVIPSAWGNDGPNYSVQPGKWFYVDAALPIPEASDYQMMLAGLAVLFMRMSKRRLG